MKVINLLPKHRQQELHYVAVLHSVWIVVWLTVFSVAAVYAVQVGTQLYLKGKVVALQQEIARLKVQVEQKENTQIKAQVKADNDIVSDFKKLADGAPQWSKVIKAFAPIPPDGVKVNSFTIDPVQKSITINGFAPTRALVIQLWNNIVADNKDFYNVDYPFENVSKPTDITYHFTFYIQNSLLQ